MSPTPAPQVLLDSPLDAWHLLALPQEALVAFVLILIRMSAFIVTAPLFSAVQVPVRFRLGLAMAVAVILLPLELGRGKVPVVNDPGTLFQVVLAEVAVGLLLGFFAMFVFHGVQFAGYMIGLQMGFGMDQVFDPNSGQELTSLSMFLTIVGMLTYLLVDAHHWLLIGFERSFSAVPLGAFRFNQHSLDGMLAAISAMFTMVFTLLLPILGILMMAEIALAITNRVMPQLNVFVAGFPIKIGLGFLSLILGLPLIVAFLSGFFDRWAHQLLSFVL